MEAIRNAEKQFDRTLKSVYTLIERIHNEIAVMPQKGDTAKTCQKINILDKLHCLEYAINGTCIEDFLK